MDWKDAIKAVNSRFKYKRDRENYGISEVWKFLGKTGEGDCEDYSLTVLWLAADQSIVTFFKLLWSGEYRLHYVNTSSGAGHLVMEHKGLFVDNVVKKPVTKDQLVGVLKYKFRYHYRFPHILLKMGVGYVIGSTVNLFRKVKNV